MKKEKLLDDQCRGTQSRENAAFSEEQTDGSETTLRAVSSAWRHRVEIHCNTKAAAPIGTLPSEGAKTIAGWTLRYEESGTRWRGGNNCFSLEIHWNVDLDDLETMLKALSRVGKESAVLEQPRRFVLRFGYPTSQDGLASAKVVAGVIDWPAHRSGHILAAALDDGSKNSALRHVIYHEATHLLEPEMREPLGQIATLIKTAKKFAWTDGKPTVALSAHQTRAISAINPHYLPERLNLWSASAAGLESQLATGLITQCEHDEKTAACDEDLAAEILVESACWLFWKTGIQDKLKPTASWEALDAITARVPERLREMASSDYSTRKRSYSEDERGNFKDREIIRVLTLPKTLRLTLARCRKNRQSPKRASP